MKQAKPQGSALDPARGFAPSTPTKAGPWMPTNRGPGAVPLVGSKGEALAGFGAAPQDLLSFPRLSWSQRQPCGIGKDPKGPQ